MKGRGRNLGHVRALGRVKEILPTLLQYVADGREEDRVRAKGKERREAESRDARIGGAERVS